MERAGGGRGSLRRARGGWSLGPTGAGGGWGLLLVAVSTTCGCPVGPKPTSVPWGEGADKTEEASFRPAAPPLCVCMGGRQPPGPQAHRWVREHHVPGLKTGAGPRPWALQPMVLS